MDITNPVEWSKICRTCLSDNIGLQSIFEASLNEMLVACTALQIKADDGLPDAICKQCIHQVKEAFRFKEQCQKSDFHLRNLLAQYESLNDDIKSEHDNADNDSISTTENDYKVEIKPEIDGLFTETSHTDNIGLDSSSQLYNSLQNPVNGVIRKGLVAIRSEERSKKRIGSRRLKRLPKRNVKSEVINNESIHTDENLECNLCGQHLNDSNQSTHEITCHQPDKHVCLSCGKEFQELKLLKRHLRVHKLQKKHLCTTCGKGFYGANDLMIHLRIHTGEKPLVCNVCAKAFSDPRGLNSHMKTHTGAKPYSCTVCNKRFAHSFVLSTHMRTHTAERPYVCSACGKTFVYAHNLAIHMRSHTGERPYPCTLCNKAFSSSSTLSAHMMTHTGEKRFVCSVCGKKVARSGDLAIHMRTHTGEKPYACTICTKRYRMSCHLTAHMKTHTGEKDHVCNVCGKAFADARVLKSHMTTHTGERPYSCSVCQKSFAHYSALSNHRKVHIDSKIVPATDNSIQSYLTH